VLTDQNPFGASLTSGFVNAAQRLGLIVPGVEGFDPRAGDFRAFAAGIAATGADCVFINGAGDAPAAGVTRAIADAMPSASIFVSSGLGTPSFVDSASGGLPAAVDSRVTITSPALGVDPGSDAAQAFARSYRSRFG